MIWWYSFYSCYWHQTRTQWIKWCWIFWWAKFMKNDYVICKTKMIQSMTLKHHELYNYLEGRIYHYYLISLLVMPHYNKALIFTQPQRLLLQLIFSLFVPTLWIYPNWQSHSSSNTFSTQANTIKRTFAQKFVKEINS